MRYWVGLTDRDWYAFLAAQPAVEEVNFWQPSAKIPVRLSVGEPFLFKLHERHGGQIVGGAFFAHYTVLPATIAWEVFGTMNGAPSFQQMTDRVRRYRSDFDVHADSIGCMALVEPFFLAPNDWVDPPADWSKNIQRGKTYDLAIGEGARVWQRVQTSILKTQTRTLVADSAVEQARYGDPILVAPRLGQGTFRATVIDAYQRRCAVTGERTLPVLQAAHIKPYSDSGPHTTENGLLLRSDLHTLFDRGYLTVTPNLELRVSGKIRAEFENGRDYYALDRHKIRSPATAYPPPSREFLEWHEGTIFRG